MQDFRQIVNAIMIKIANGETLIESEQVLVRQSLESMQRNLSMIQWLSQSLKLDITIPIWK